MSNMKFKYFRDPDNFAFKTDSESDCSVCGRLGKWFDAGGFYGVDDIECICDDCLAGGRLKELEIETNEASNGSVEEIDEIIYATPSLPTWQDRIWPYINGNYPVFERIASKEDFDDINEFKAAFSTEDADSSDLDWLWEILPDKKLKSYHQGGDVTVYLFSSNSGKHCKWDAN